VRTHGTFNETRTAPSDLTFFAIQAAISSYPDDPLRDELATIVDKISATTDQALQSKYAAEGCALAAGAVRFTEYCVWDYSLVHKIAKTEFASWIDGIQESVNTSKDENLDSSFMDTDTSYIVATFAVLSTHSSLRNWLDYLELAPAKNYFTRQSIENLWEHLAKSESNILVNCLNALFAVTPVQKDRWYAGDQLRSEDWNYLRPVY
jgi:hypothetical protein